MRTNKVWKRQEEQNQKERVKSSVGIRHGKKRYLMAGLCVLAASLMGNMLQVESQAAGTLQEMLSIGAGLPQNTSLESHVTGLTFPLVLPERWDAREQGRKPTVKRQGSYGTCWALAAASALETTLLPAVRTEFSADHMALNNHFETSLTDGGDYVMIMAYLSGWQGPVTEEEDPYGDAYSPNGLEPAVHVQEIRLLEGSTRQEIKEAVYRYGAVQTSLYMSRAETLPEKGFYQKENAAYYYPETQTQNHDVVILGWDDHYSRYHFNQTPPIDGAFICQNSWGDSFGEDGVFYVSYADANIGRTGLAYSRVESVDNYAAIYQTDDCGWQGQQGYADETCWFANVYTAGMDSGVSETPVKTVTAGNTGTEGSVRTESETAEREGAVRTESETAEPEGGAQTESEAAGTEETAWTEPEDTDGIIQTEDEHELSAYGFYATGPDTSYELYLVRGFETAESFADMEYLQSGTLEQAGYYTVDLNQPVLLNEGERFAVIVKITTPGAENPAAVEYRADSFTRNVTTEGKEGYLSQYGERWEHTEQRFGSNVCLKAYFRK